MFGYLYFGLKKGAVAAGIWSQLA